MTDWQTEQQHSSKKITWWYEY